MQFDQGLGLVTTHGRQCTGQHQGSAGQALRARLGRLALVPAQPAGAQLLDDLAVVRLGEELDDAARNHRPHVVELLQCRLVCFHQRVQTAEVPGEILGGRFADIANAECEDEAGERRVSAPVDRGQQVRRGFLAHARQIGQLDDAKAVQIGWRAHDRRVDQLFDQLVAQAVDVDRSATGEMDQRLLSLRRTEQAAGATGDRLVFAANDMRAAHRTADRHHERPLVAVATLDDRCDHLRDHVPCPSDDDLVADQQTLAANLVLIVQGRIRDGGAPDENRPQTRHRRQCAGPSDLDLDVDQFGELFLGRILVRDRPAGLARHETEFALQVDAIDLVHHAVDVVRQVVSQRFDPCMKSDQTVRAT